MTQTKFKIEDIDWNEMNAIGISYEFLVANQAIEAFLDGEITQALNLDIVLLGNEHNIDATLQLLKKGQSPVVNVVCVNREDFEAE